MRILYKHTSRDSKIELFQIFFYFALFICYYYLTHANRYFIFDVQPIRSFVAISVMALVIKLSKYIGDDFLYFIYQLTVALIVTGECVYYQCVPDSRAECMFAGVVFLIMLFLMQIIQFKVININKNERNIKLLFGLVLLFFIPYIIANIKYINLNNLLLQNIYNTRLLYREINKGIPFIGYIVPILARIILPFFICEALTRKQWLKTATCICLCLFLFLCGGLKSILFGLISVLVFYPSDYEEKVKHFYVGLTILVLLSVFVYCFLDSYSIIDYMRRIFFVPADLENIYVNYFSDNYTYMAHSNLTFGLLDNPYGPSLSMFIGENLIGIEGLNANIGVFVEGFISFGYFGIFLIASLLSLIFQFFKSEKINPRYAGIFFTYIYTCNTSFLHTLLGTHGLLFLVVFSFLVMQSGNRNTATRQH